MLSSSKYNVGKLGVGGQTKQVQTLPYAHWEFLEKCEIHRILASNFSIFRVTRLC